MTEFRPTWSCRRIDEVFCRRAIESKFLLELLNTKLSDEGEGL